MQGETRTQLEDAVNRPLGTVNWRVTSRAASMAVIDGTECCGTEMAVKPSDLCPQTRGEKVQLSFGHLPSRYPEATDVTFWQLNE